MKKKVLSLVTMIMGLAITAGVYWWTNLRPAKPDHKSRFTVSKTTTVVDGPLDDDGYIDYAAALNQRMRGGIMPETNANLLLWQAIGPHPDGANVPTEYFNWLGTNPPSEEGTYSDRIPADPAAMLKLAQQKPWKADQHPLISDWLKRNENPLAIVFEATRRPDYFNPIVPKKTSKGSQGIVSSPLYTAQSSRDIASALVARAMLRLGSGKAEEAWLDLITCHRLGLLIGRGSSSVEWLVGVAIHEIMLPAEIEFASHPAVPLNLIQQSLRDLLDLPQMSSLPDKFDAGERFLFLDIVLNINRQGISYCDNIAGDDTPAEEKATEADRFLNSINFDHSLQIGNEWFDRIIQAMKEKEYRSRLAKMGKLHKDLLALKEKVEGKKSFIEAVLTAPLSDEDKNTRIGELLITRFTPAFVKLQVSADRFEQNSRNLRIAFALASYFGEFGRYPAKLEDIRSKHLHFVPNDLFSSNALVYHLTENGYLLYSVGPNMRDEGGRTRNDEPRGDDIRIRLPANAL
jgi:hypothetical protein